MQPSLSLPSAKRISDKREVNGIEENNEKEVENKQKASKVKGKKNRELGNGDKPPIPIGSTKYLPYRNRIGSARG